MSEQSSLPRAESRGHVLPKPCWCQFRQADAGPFFCAFWTRSKGAGAQHLPSWGIQMVFFYNYTQILRPYRVLEHMSKEKRLRGFSNLDRNCCCLLMRSLVSSLVFEADNIRRGLGVQGHVRQTSFLLCGWGSACAKSSIFRYKYIVFRKCN